jgi:Flp pilus assembly protein TadG
MQQGLQLHVLGRRRRERGQGLLEFSLITVFLTILLMGVLDLARAYYSYLALKDAAEEGAYYGSAFPQCVNSRGINNDSIAGCSDPNNLPYRVRHAAPLGGLISLNDPSTQVTVDLPCGSTLPCNMQSGQVLTVTVQYPYQVLTPFVGTIVNSQILTLTARSSAVIVRVPNCTVSPCN